MLKHIVSIKLKNDVEKEYISQEFKKICNTIKEVKKLNIYENAYEKRATNFDLQFELMFNDINALEKYLVDKIHIKFVETIVKPNAIEIGTFDYIIK